MWGLVAVEDAVQREGDAIVLAGGFGDGQVGGKAVWGEAGLFDEDRPGHSRGGHGEGFDVAVDEGDVDSVFVAGGVEVVFAGGAGGGAGAV